VVAAAEMVIPTDLVMASNSARVVVAVPVAVASAALMPLSVRE
jgi:hypothetical protein